MTIGLALITNKDKETIELVDKYGKYFDKVYITVADKTQKLYNELRSAYKDHDKVEVSFFKWIDHFGKARIYNQSQIKTDYWMWLDTDDEIDKPELLPAIFNYTYQKELDAVAMIYQYYTNEHNESEGDHWRERIIKTDGPFKWADVPCHETVTAQFGRQEKVVDVRVLHHKSMEGMKAAITRNQKLLEADWPVTKDPRTAYYLGMTYANQENYDKSIEMFSYLIEHGGWDEQKVVALNVLSQCYYLKKDYGKAIVCADQAIHLEPDNPDAWYQKAMIYTALDQPQKAIVFAEIALDKKPREDSMQLIDPTRYTYKGLFVAAQAYLFAGMVEKAFELYRKLMETAPHFVQANNTKDVNWNKLFEEAYYDQKAVDYTRYLSAYFRQTGGDAAKLFGALPRKLYSDARLNAERVQVFPPKKWPEKSIAYYVGPGYENWGPDTLDKGMGGSEEAVIYLSRELAKLGWNVHVYCDREDEYDDNGVIYHPWTELNPFDTFDVFIASRQPANAKNVKARKLIVDMHDTIPEEHLKAVEPEVSKFLVKSKWHRDLYPNLPDDKFAIIGNGIVKEQFNGN